MAVGDKKPAIMRDDVGKLVPHAIHANQHAIGESDPITPEMIGAVSASNGTIDVSDLDNIKAPGHYLFVDNTGSFGFVGALYDLEVSNQLYDNVHESIVQRATRTYGADISAVFERVYYYANTNYWTPWKELATTDYANSLALNNNALVSANTTSDVLHVDLNDPGSAANRSAYFDSSAANIPTSITAFGVREVHFVFPGFVVVEARCFVTDSSVRVYYNAFNKNAGTWMGWREHATTDTALMKSEKPSGSYTGNGSAATRELPVDGIGEALLIRNSTNGRSAIVMYAGAIAIHSDGTLKGYPYVETRFVNNNIILNTADYDFNSNGVKYEYWRL